MKVNGWKCYSHAAIPSTEPNETVNIKAIKSGDVWKLNGFPLFARWTENFDCGKETQWWYCIKDEKFDFKQIKSNRRTAIKRALKLNIIKIVKPSEYVDDIFEISKSCYDDYPKQYRPTCTREGIKKQCKVWDEKRIVFIAFSKESNKAIGFSCIRTMEKSANLEILKVPNSYKRLGVTLALVYNILEVILDKYNYISDGERNMVHKTNFMDYLVKKFNFRYAYCDLKIEYRPLIKVVIKCLYPLRRKLEMWSGNNIIYKIVAVLKMEEIARKNKKRMITYE